MVRREGPVERSAFDCEFVPAQLVAGCVFVLFLLALGRGFGFEREIG